MSKKGIVGAAFGAALTAANPTAANACGTWVHSYFSGCDEWVPYYTCPGEEKKLKPPHPAHPPHPPKPPTNMGSGHTHTPTYKAPHQHHTTPPPTEPKKEKKPPIDINKFKEELHRKYTPEEKAKIYQQNPEIQ